MSATRLLVLGAVRILQPVHGYDVRRELLTWRLEELANVKPGSIYGAMKTLQRDGAIAVYAHEEGTTAPARTSYVITAEGEKEFQVLLRQGWWSVSQPAEPLVPALCLMLFLPREELVAALTARASQLRADITATGFTRGSIKDGATGAEGEIPEHVREILDFTTGRAESELTWTKGLLERVRSGSYTFAGEPGFLDFGPGHLHSSS